MICRFIRVVGGNKLKSATEVYDEAAERKYSFPIKVKKGKTYIVSINELGGSSDMQANYTGGEVLYTGKMKMNASGYPTAITSVINATGDTITLNISGTVNYIHVKAVELN